MTTPTFHEWAVMFGKCIQGHGPREFERSKLLARYILSRIERKEKALREELQLLRSLYVAGIDNQFAVADNHIAERSRIAERVRRLGWKEAHELADDIKEGKV